MKDAFARYASNVATGRDWYFKSSREVSWKTAHWFNGASKHSRVFAVTIIYKDRKTTRDVIVWVHDRNGKPSGFLTEYADWGRTKIIELSDSDSEVAA